MTYKVTFIIINMTERNKLFPLKLPKSFHGSGKVFKTPSEVYAEKAALRQEGVVDSKKISNWKRKILDRDVVSERQQFIVHPAKISLDNPDWVKSTFHHFNRSNASVGKRETLQQKKNYDVFGNKKVDPTRYFSEKQVTFKQIKIKPEVTPKIGVDFRNQTGVGLRLNKSSFKSQVASKIGSIQLRQNLVKKPQLKVGSLHSYNFVDTYSVN